MMCACCTIWGSITAPSCSCWFARYYLRGVLLTIRNKPLKLHRVLLTCSFHFCLLLILVSICFCLLHVCASLLQAAEAAGSLLDWRRGLALLPENAEADYQHKWETAVQYLVSIKFVCFYSATETLIVPSKFSF